MNRARQPFDDADDATSAANNVAVHVQPHTAPALFVPGQLVAERFAIERFVGSGGMGSVYRAIDLNNGTPVAIKAVARLQSSSGERFAREARMLAQLSHPAVVRYIAHGITDGHAQFLAMEWLDGEDLGTRLARAGLLVSETLTLIRRLCEGLATAHALGVIHRDLKPSNLFLVGGRTEAAKLLDFGVARQRGEGAAQTLTHAGAVLGTVGYMAPEQAMGVRDVDARADVFALGCVLFECLTGHPAFHGPHDVAVLAKVLREDAPRVHEFRPDLGADLDALVACLLAKDRAQRPSDAHAVLRALDQLGESRGSAAPSPRSTPSARLVESEQRIASVVVTRVQGAAAATLTHLEADLVATQLDDLLRRFGAEPLPLRAGQFVLVFGAGRGTVASDQAAQAVRCALRLQRLKPGLPAVVATGGVESSLPITVGAAIDRASALLAALPEQTRGVTIDELTAGLLDGRFEIERSHGLTVVRENGETERPRLLLGKPSPCVGREKELGLLEATLAEAIDDDVARVLLVTAQPGMGKSRLAREFLGRAPARAVRTLFARADPLAQGSAWSLMQRLIAHGCGIHESDAASLRRLRILEHLRERVDASTAEWLSEFLSELLGVPIERAPSLLLAAARNDPAIMREQTRKAVQCWLAAELVQGPLLIVLEDLHWADLPSVALLAESLGTLADRPLLLLAFARPDVYDHFPELWRAIGCQEYQLQGLTRRAAERLILGALPASIERPIVERILDLAQGNAFYLEELIRHVAQGESELPETVRAMARSRLERLSPDARRHMRAASVFGEVSWVGAVSTLLGHAGDPTGDTAADFEQLVREEIFVRRSQSRFRGEPEYAFRHALLRDAAYSMLTEDDRRLAHGLAGEWLEQAGERDPCVLADHFESSTLPQRALPWLLRAGRAALVSGDLAGVVLLAQRGLRLGPSSRERADLLLIQAHASAWGTQTNLDLAEEALRLFPVGTSSWWFSLALMAFGASAIGRSDLAEPYLELAQRTPPPENERLGMHGQAFEVLAVGAALVGRADIGWALLGKLRTVVAQLPFQDTLSKAWLNIAHCQLATNSLEEGTWQLARALRAGQQAVAGMREGGAVSGEGTALFHLGITWLELGGYSQAEQLFDESLQKSVQTGNVLIAEFSRLVLAVFALRQGRTEHGLSLLDALGSSSDANIVHGAKTVRAEVHLRAGKVHDALALASDSVSGPGLIYRLRASLTLARAQRVLEQPGRALRVLEEAIAARGPTSFPQLEVDLQTMRAELSSQLGDRETATTAARKALAFAAQTLENIEDDALRTAFLKKLCLSPRLKLLAVG